jgi:hypothetical protein
LDASTAWATAGTLLRSPTTEGGHESLVNQRHGDDDQDDAEPEQEPDRQPSQTGTLSGRRQHRGGPHGHGDDARLGGRFKGRTFL